MSARAGQCDLMGAAKDAMHLSCSCGGKAPQHAGAAVLNSLPHLKELLHHQPSQVMATLVSWNARERRFSHQRLHRVV